MKINEQINLFENYGALQSTIKTIYTLIDICTAESNTVHSAEKHCELSIRQSFYIYFIEMSESYVRAKHWTILTSVLLNSQSGAVCRFFFFIKRNVFSSRQKFKKLTKMSTENVLRFPHNSKDQSKLAQTIGFFTTSRGVKFSRKVITGAAVGIGAAFWSYESAYFHKYIDVVRAYR